MPNIEVEHETRVERTFRVEQAAGLFDVGVGERSRLSLRVHVPPPAPGIDGPGKDETSGGASGGWRIGVIVGPSGCGKTSVARRAYGDAFLENSGGWPKLKSILDGFPGGLSMKQITGALNAVGFSSPPAWVLPYGRLSTGQRMRCDLARALLEERDVLAFDEFTSVVDRQVGRFCSAAVSKAVRKRRVPLERFVAVTCHRDVIDWLEPDWVLEVDKGRLTASPGKLSEAQLPRGCLHRRREPWRRPKIEVEVRRATTSLWPVFEPHHYLSASLHRAARCYAATWEGEPIGFLATLPSLGHVGRRRVHRLVVLPDFQGLGVGLRLLDAVAGIEHGEGYRVSIRTSHPALIAALRDGGRKRGWRVGSIARHGVRHGDMGRELAGSQGRAVVSFAYRPDGRRK